MVGLILWLIQIIFNHINFLLSKIELKIAKINHAKFLYVLYNYSIKKGFSKTIKKISYKNHLNWFKKKIKEKFTKIFIGYLGLKKIGYVRYEKISKNKYIVSIAVHPTHIGKGLGGNLLKLSIKKFKRNKEFISLFALVKKNNLPSHKIFLKNNFKLKNKLPKLIVSKNIKNFNCYEFRSRMI